MKIRLVHKLLKRALRGESIRQATWLRMLSRVGVDAWDKRDIELVEVLLEANK